VGIYSREYIRELHSNSGGWGGGAPVVKYIILANIAVFVLQLVVVREGPSPLEEFRRQFPKAYQRPAGDDDDGEVAAQESEKNRRDVEKAFEEQLRETMVARHRPKVSILQEWFELDTPKVVRGQVWRLVTSAFCHSRYDIWHIVFNMLCLYWFGCTLEAMYGSREFLWFYLTAAAASGLTFVGMDLYTGSTVPAVGASGAVIAVMMLYTWHYPRQTILIFGILPIEMRWLMALYLIWDLHPVILNLSGEHYITGVAHAAHLGGLAFGFLYGRYQWRLDGLLHRLPSPRRAEAFRPRLYVAPKVAEPKPSTADNDRLDQILRKIFDHGQASLTDDERAILNEASERIKRRS
jgi:rhomboid family protein